MSEVLKFVLSRVLLQLALSPITPIYLRSNVCAKANDLYIHDKEEHKQLRP
jgi:hypothetical protein